MAYIAVNDTAANKSMIVRIKGFDSIDYSQTSFDVARQSQCYPYSSASVSRLSADTLYLDADSNYWIDRPISSLLVDTTEGAERIIITFEGYNDEYANVAEVSNPQGAWTISQRPISGQSSLPAYCAMVEASTGNLYVGTANGVWIDNNGWSQYDHLRGLPVTSMVQQKAALKARYHISHNGITPEYYTFPKTKWPGAIYFGTYGRGIFMDMT
jgi:ligand-binding sensor domain-containing protein